MHRNVSKRIFCHVHPRKIQISLRIIAVWTVHEETASEGIQNALSEDSDRAGWPESSRMSEGTFSE